MNNGRKEFCEQTIKTIEAKIALLLCCISENSSSKQDKRVAGMIQSLTAARKALLAELEDYE